MKNKISLLILMTILILSCTEKPVTIPEFELPDSDRVVLLEELTGVRCPNCPSGAAKVEELLGLYEGKLVVMAIHGDFDAEPLPENAYDFRTEEAYDLEHLLEQLWGKPSARINRVRDAFGTTAYIGIDTWGGYIEHEFEKPQQVELFLETSFNESDRKLSVNVKTLPLANLSGTFNINVAITESHIIDAQLNQNMVIPDYEHNHVFRKMLTNVNGDLLTSSLVKNELINSYYEFTLPQDAHLWVPENCNVVAFITLIEGDDQVVLQAAEAAVAE